MSLFYSSPFSTMSSSANSSVTALFTDSDDCYGIIAFSLGTFVEFFIVSPIEAPSVSCFVRPSLTPLSMLISMPSSIILKFSKF